MMASKKLLKFVCFIFYFLLVKSVTHGDEQYSNLDGYFWIFNSTGILIAHATQKQITGFLKSPTSKWGDNVYLRDQAALKHYMFANDGGNKQVKVFDTYTNSPVSTIQLSSTASPVHLYGVYYYDQFWSHDDTSGSFNVLRASQVRYREAAGVKASSLDVIKNIFTLIYKILLLFVIFY
jgi:hypothetical protein